MKACCFGEKVFILILAALVTGLVFVPAVSADNVFKWEDSSGTVHFSTKAPSGEAKPAKLPPIMRAEVKIPKPKSISCATHGGIDCGAGPDGDGSVICHDGFMGATNRYRFSCNSPKLNIAEVSDLKEDGTFSIFVRNSKSVVAESPALFFKPETGSEVKLSGPEKIEEFGVAEFVLGMNSHNSMLGKPTLGQLKLTCANCP